MTTKSIYITLRVNRPLNKEELDYLDRMDNKTHRQWEHDRQSMLFEIAVLAKSETHAITTLRKMLRSPKLIIERVSRNGVSRNVQKVPPSKPKG